MLHPQQNGRPVVRSSVANSGAVRLTASVALLFLIGGALIAGGHPTVYVPLINQTIRRNRIVEIPEIHVIEKLVPKIKVQDVIRKVPKTDVRWVEKVVEVPQVQVGGWMQPSIGNQLETFRQ